MNINKIVKMKNDKYKIYFNDSFIETYDNVILENDLLYKKSFDNNLYKKIIEDTKYYDIYNKTVKYILKKKRSEKEIKKYLDKFDISLYNKNEIINKLKEIKLINDIEFCSSYINDKLHLSKDGMNKIKKDLLDQNIPIEIINSELEKVDKDILNDRLENQIKKIIKSNKKYSNKELKYKILNNVINLGYEKDKTLEIIDKNIKFDNSILEHEFNKIYNKLKLKYSSYELQNKVKSKLFQKGFEVEEISKLLQKKAED